MKSSNNNILIIGLSWIFVVYRYILQVAPSVMAPFLMQEFNMHGLTAGNLSAAFLYTLVIMQVFSGYLLDRYHPLWITVFSITLCSIGALGFAYATHIYVAILMRAFMGIGSAFAVASYYKMAVLGDSERYLSLISGLLGSAVTVGIVLGQLSLSQLMRYTTWRNIMLLYSILGFLLALLFLFSFQKRFKASSSIATKHSKTLSFLEVAAMLRHPQNWFIAFYSGFAFEPLGVFAGFWGISFLKTAYHVSAGVASLLTACVFIGFGIGSPFFGLLSDRFKTKRIFMSFSGIATFLILICIIYFPYISLKTLATLLSLFGFFTGALMLGFTFSQHLQNPKASATLVTLLNTVGVGISAITEPVIGSLLDRSWQGEWIQGVPLFSIQNYQYAFSLLPFYLIGALVTLALMRDAQNAVNKTGK